jgi:WD40 repeat protein
MNNTPRLRIKHIAAYAVTVLLALLVIVALALGGEPPQPPLATSGARLAAHFVGMVSRSAQPVRALAFSPDGSLLAATGVDGAVQVIALADRQILHRFDHPGGATALAFAPDGGAIATAGYDGRVRLWRLADGTVHDFRVSHAPLWTLTFDPAGTHLAAAGEDKRIHLWPIDGSAPGRTFAGHDLNIWHIAFTADGKALASGSFDRTLKLWDVAGGRLLRSATGHTQGIVGLDVRAHDGLIATGGDDGTIRLWRSDGAPLRTIAAGQFVDTVAFSADGNWLAAGGRESHGRNAVFKQLFGRRPDDGHGVSARIWRVRDGAMVAAFDRQEDDVVAVAISPDGRWFASGSDDGSVALWRLTQVN